MNKGLFTVVVMLIGAQLFAQSFNKKQQIVYDEAEELYDMGNYFGAYHKYVELHRFERDFYDMNYKMGVCVFSLGGDVNEAISYFESATSGDNTMVYYYLGQCYHRLEQFKIAIQNYQYFKEHDFGGEISVEEVNRLIDISLLAGEMKKNPVKMEIQNLGENINSIHSDYVPSVTQNDSLMFFTSRRENSTGGLKDPFDNYFEDIYYSTKSHGQWSKAINAGSVVNTNTHDACVGLSADGKTLLLFRTNESQTGGDLYYSDFTNGAWNTPVKFPEAINSHHAEASATLTSDGNTMYFSSNREGGEGGKDIYKSVRFGNGDWSLPTNLGPNINTPYDDDAPFIAADDKTLYFSSKGHKTIGGYDIFKTSMDAETKVWGIPHNLGYPVNTVDDDIYFVITGDDRTGYYSSSKRGGYGNQDIYEVDLLDKNTIISIVKGVVNDDDGAPVGAKITLIDEESNKVQGVYRSNSKNGKYIMTISPGVSYKMMVSKRGFETVTHDVVYQSDDNFSEFQKDLVLTESQ